MTKSTVKIDSDLKKRLNQYIAVTYDVTHGKIQKVIVEALEQFLEKHGFGRKQEPCPPEI